LIIIYLFVLVLVFTRPNIQRQNCTIKIVN